MNPRSLKFRELFQNPPFVCMGVHDAISAKLAEDAGAKALFVSGFVASAVIAGKADIGILSQTEMFDHIRRICRASTVPVFADCDTGYGGILETQRTMELWEEAGASCLHIEDQAMPKKCGHFAGKQLVSKDEMVMKLRAMVAARKDPNFFIVARTDAIAVNGLADALDRLEAYAATGVDGLYADAPESVEQLKAISARLKPLGKPILFNMARSGKSPYLSLEALHTLGFDFAICPIEPMFAMHKALKRMYETFLQNGCSTDAIADQCTPFDEFNRFVGLDESIAIERKFGTL